MDKSVFIAHSVREMNPYRKGAAFLIRLIAVGLMLVPLIILGLDFFATKAGKKSDSSSLSKIIPMAAGFVLLLASGTIAKKLTQDLDE